MKVIFHEFEWCTKFHQAQICQSSRETASPPRDLTGNIESDIRVCILVDLHIHGRHLYLSKLTYKSDLSVCTVPVILGPRSPIIHFRPAVRPDDVRHLGPERGRAARAGAVADAGGRGRRAEDGRPRGEAEGEERQGGGAGAATQVRWRG